MKRFFEWAIMVAFFKAPLAMAVGIIIEVFFVVFTSLIIGDQGWWVAYENWKWSFYIDFVVFHIIGWVVVQRDWPFIEGTRADVDPLYNMKYDEDEAPLRVTLRNPDGSLTTTYIYAS